LPDFERRGGRRGADHALGTPDRIKDQKIKARLSQGVFEPLDPVTTDFIKTATR
jgi:hypothetical protein